jgi:uncharacterized Tic20 family protein
VSTVTAPDDPIQPPAPEPRPLTSEERGWGLAAHLSAFAGAWVALAFVGPLVVYLIGRDRGDFVTHHAKEALNFNLTILAAAVAAILVTIVGGVVTLGVGLIVLVPVLAILGGIIAIGWLVLTIVAAARAWDGQGYRYPFTIRFVN